MESPKESTGQKVYSTTAEIGRVYATFIAVIAVAIMLIIVIVGTGNLLTKKPNGWGMILGGLLTGGIGLGIAYLARRYKGFAAFEGVVGISDVARAVI